MGSFKDLTRIFNGLSLIAKEFVNRSSPLESTITVDFETLIKKALISATDLSGFTKEKVRQFSNPEFSDSRIASDSVVYFADSPDVLTTNDDNVSISSSKTNNVAVGDDGIESPAGNCKEAFDASLDANVNSTPEILVEGRHCAFIDTVSVNGEASVEVATALPLKKRKLRERKVPSTPFSRVLGFAEIGASLAWGTLQESAKRVVYGMPDSLDNQSAISPFLSEKNAECLALALCRMHGAALKL